MIIALDLETKSSVDLRKHGLDRYVNSPDFEITVAAFTQTSDTAPMRGAKADSFDIITHGRQSFRRRLQELLGFVRNHNEPSMHYAPRVPHATILAHNSQFEKAALTAAGFDISGIAFVDTAVVARIVGVRSSLDSASRQITDVRTKMPEGVDLIKRFAIPREDGTFLLDHPEDFTQEDHNLWSVFVQYCERDAEVCGDIFEKYWNVLSGKELSYMLATDKMNEVGWFVDVDLVERMKEVYERNLEELERRFRSLHLGPDEVLNLNSVIQLRAWCKRRRVNISSFDSEHVEKYLRQVSERLAKLVRDVASRRYETETVDLYQVEELLKLKQQLGGSSLKKLQTILDTVGPDGRLRYQYVHGGAAQSLRTSGRSVQMQNLKRLPKTPLSEESITDLGPHSGINNETLAQNLRQVFKAEAKKGIMLVGDFSSVESRALAWAAGASWKVKSFAEGHDMYKVMASKIFKISYEDVVPAQRQIGKVGELACGYGAGAATVNKFAEKMGVPLETDETTQLVADWRELNPEVTSLWDRLDAALREELARNGSGQAFSQRVQLSQGYSVAFTAFETDQSIRSIVPTARDISMVVYNDREAVFFRRIFRGVYERNGDICYMKPSALKSGPLWQTHWTKNGQRGPHKLYGGKLTGILVQSLCRELFFNSLVDLQDRLQHLPYAKIVGQFHDEIVVELDLTEAVLFGRTADEALIEVKHKMRVAMTSSPLPGFPLDSEIKFAHRYLK